jgi:hypothetical protein
MSCWLRWYYFPWIMMGAKVWECHAPCTLAFYEKEDALYQIHKTKSLTFHHLIRDRNCLPFANSWVHTQVLVSVAHLFSFLCFLFCLSSFCILCTQCCQLLWVIHSWLPLRVSLTFIFLKQSKFIETIFLFLPHFRIISTYRWACFNSECSWNICRWSIYH